MKSLQKPRKISALSEEGLTYIFLCKPKDDLRKDARLMDLNSMINKLLKKNAESRRRQLRGSFQSPYLSSTLILYLNRYSNLRRSDSERRMRFLRMGSEYHRVPKYHCRVIRATGYAVPGMWSSFNDNPKLALTVAQGKSGIRLGAKQTEAFKRQRSRGILENKAYP